MASEALKIGQMVYLVEAITRKSDGAIVGATVGRFRVISFDDDTVVCLHNWYTGDGETDGRSIGDLVGVRFVARGEVWLTQEEAERVHAMVVAHADGPDEIARTE